MITKNEAVPHLAKALEMKSLFFKREDLHPYGSHKGRSIPVMIDTYLLQGIKYFAITGSGNAALAAALHVEKLNKDRIGDEKINLDILVGQKISPKKLGKLDMLRNQYVHVTMHDRPLQTLFTKIQDPLVRALRQSTDDLSLLGYEALGKELLDIPELSAIFIGTSSGTTAQALAEYFKNKGAKIEMNIVQTSSCHPMVESLENENPLEEVSIADAIVDQGAIRKPKLLELIEESGGTGWIVSNEQIKVAQEITKKNTDISISTNSALSVAGLMQAAYTGREWRGAVVCMICGD
ncbi:MAG: PLP-dependent lyase/thiolase [Patescibacteria group bacterium]